MPREDHLGRLLNLNGAAAGFMRYAAVPEAGGMRCDLDLAALERYCRAHREVTP